jgi:two-component system cell cycle response regulator
LKRSILIVDDERFFRDILRDVLSDSYEVIESPDGEDAFAIAERLQPDLIILDVEMPGKNGLEVCRELKEGVLTRTIPVLILSAHDDKSEIIDGLQAGADDYVIKPINAEEVLARVDAHLRTKNLYSSLEENDLRLLLELSETISASRNPIKILQTIVEKIADVVEVARCSILSLSDGGELVVKACSDLNKAKDIHLEMWRYPEITSAIKSRKTVLINDMKNDPMLEPVREYIKFLPMNSIVVVPILKKQSIIGTFFLRTASPLRFGINNRVVNLCQLISNMSANALENALLFESMKNAQSYLEDLAIRDGLTQLYNHQHFHTRLAAEFSRARRYSTKLSCLFIDIDDFKKVNDLFEHSGGDEVLRQVGGMIRELVRESDVAARYGGDEFAILLPNTDREGALDLAGRLCTAINGQGLNLLKGEKITLSIGISTYHGANMLSCDQVVQMADKAMYHAKKQGKDRISFITEPEL